MSHNIGSSARKIALYHSKRLEKAHQNTTSKRFRSFCSRISDHLLEASSTIPLIHFTPSTSPRSPSHPKFKAPMGAWPSERAESLKTALAPSCSTEVAREAFVLFELLVIDMANTVYTWYKRRI